MSNSNGFIEILIDAAINNKSIDKINKQIEQIQNNLKSVDIDLNVNSNSGNNKVFAQMEKQIEDLQNQIKKLESSLASVGSSSSTKGKNGKIFSGISEDIINTFSDLESLKKYLKTEGYSVNVDFDVDEKGVRTVKSVIAQIKDELGDIQTLKIKPVVDSASGETRFNVHGERNQDSNQRDLIKNQQEFIKLLEEAGRVGRISSEELAKFQKRAYEAGSNTNLEELIREFKELNQVASHETKWGNAQVNLRNQANQSIEILERLKTEMSHINHLDSSQIDNMILKLREFSNIEFSNDEDIKKANAEFASLSKIINQLKNDGSSLETSIETLEKSLVKASHQGLLTSERIEDITQELLYLKQNSDLPLDEKLQEVARIARDVSNELDRIKRANEIDINTEKAQRQLEKLQADLTKVINANKKTINMDEANDISVMLTRLSNPQGLTDLNSIKAYRAELDKVHNRILQLNADATRGSRQNLTIIEAFKTAMERK